MKKPADALRHIRRSFFRKRKKETGCSDLQRCSQQSLQDRADRSIFSIGSGAAAVKRKNSRKMQKFRKQESTNISPRKVRFCLTSVLQIIIMKKLHRGVAQMVARMVRDHEAASSSLATPTILTKRYRCVWRKARRINRFRAFSSPDFFSQTIDANRCFRASAPIRTGRFPVSCRCVQPAPFFSGDFSGWQRYFSQKRITKIWASFCWS